MYHRFTKFTVVLYALFLLTLSVSAETFTITGPGVSPAADTQAIKKLVDILSNEPTIAELDYVPAILKPTELLEALENDIVDFALVPFEAIPTLRNSPLLEPFLARNATEMRKVLDSQVGAYEKTKLKAI